jgi:molybdopterin-guanine dinucleotide biosynthesis protein B
MFPVISIVGESKSGKTTLLELLIGELKARGHRLAAIKHSRSEFETDQPGKDSWRLRQAGCDVVILSSSKKVAFVKERERDAALEELFYYVDDDVDLVLTEGFKKAETPKIEVHRRGGGGLVCQPEQLIAVVTDEALDVAVPQYSPRDVKGLADLIEGSILASPIRDQASVAVNGTYLPLNPFVSDLLSRTLIGMVSTLGDVGEIDSLHVRLKRGKT